MDELNKYLIISNYNCSISNGYYILDNSSKYIEFSLSLSSSDIADFSVVDNALLLFDVGTRPTDSNLHNVVLYLIKNNVETPIDYPTFDNINCKLVFDISALLFKNKRETYTFRVRCNNGKQLYVESGQNTHKLYAVSFSEKNLFYQQPSLSKNLTDRISYSINLLSGSYSFKKTLPNDVLKYDLSLIYDCYSDDVFAFFPQRWKLSILEQLIFNKDEQNNLVSITYIDSSYTRHEFIKDTNSNPYFYEDSGAGLVIEHTSQGYKIFDGIGTHYKLFDSSSGFIKEIRDNFNRSVSFTYYLLQNAPLNNDNEPTRFGGGGLIIDPPGPIVLYRYIDITDYDGRIVRIKQPENSSTIIYISIYENQASLNLNASTYEYVLNISNGYLTSIQEESTKYTYIYYNITHQITSLREFTQYRAIFTYEGEKISNIEHRFGTNDVVDKYSIDYQIGRIILKDFHNIENAYVYENPQIKGVTYSNEIPLRYGYISPKTHRLVRFPSNGYLYKNLYDSGSPHMSLETIGNGITLQAGKKYVLAFKYIKGSYDNEPVVPTRFKNNVYIQSAILEEDFHFNSYSREGEATFIFAASNNQLPDFDIYTDTYRTSSHILEAYIYLFEYTEEVVDGCYFTRQSTDYYLTSNNVVELNGNICTKKDILANEIIRFYNTFKWVCDKKKLLNDSSLVSYDYKENGNVLFSVIFSNMVLKEKKMVKTYDNGVSLVPIYTVRYKEYINGNFLFHLDTCIDANSVYHTSQRYDYYFRLVEEINEYGVKTIYEYDDYDNATVKTITNSGETINVRSEYSFDSSSRLISQIDDRYFVNDTTSTFYQNAYLTSSGTTRNTYSTIFRSFDNAHLKTTSLSNDSATCLNFNYIGEKLATFNNGSYFRYTYGDYNLLNGFSLKTGSAYQSLFSFSHNLDEDGNSVTTNYANGYIKTVNCNKYGNVVNIVSGNQETKFLYFDIKPDNLDSINASGNISAFSNLYKITDGFNSNYHLFDYNAKGQLSSFDYKKVVDSNITHTLINESLSYDFYSRLSSKLTETLNSEFNIVYTYENNNATTPKKVETAFSGDDIFARLSERVEYDSLRRVYRAYITEGFLENCFSEYIYPEQTVNNKNYSSFLPTRIDEYYNYGILTTNEYRSSTHIGYNHYGNIIHLYPGDQNLYDDTAGQEYNYDNKGQLAAETNYDYERIFNYSYDSNGNITSVSEYDLSNNLLSTDTYEYDDYYKDKLMSFNGESITYDANFNPLTIGSSISLSWTRGRLLNSITINNVSTSFEYDYLGFRLMKTNGCTVHEYFYDENHRLVEETIKVNDQIDKVITFIYGLNSIIGIRVDDRAEENISIYRFQKNILNDVTAIYQGDTLIAAYLYDAWGNHKVYFPDGTLADSTDIDFIGIINPIRYRSYYYDQETDLYYCQSRYYYSKFRRWLNMDMISYIDLDSVRGTNLFCYCKNNPIMYSDETGSSITLAILLTIYATFSSTASGVSLQIFASAVSYVAMAMMSIWDEEIRENMNAIKWNPFNSDPSLVLNAKASFYLGVPFFRSPFGDRPFNFLGVCLDSGRTTKDVSHEFGHTFQQMFLGPIPYLLYIMIPSANEWGVKHSENYEEEYESYQRRPWEMLANILGGNTEFDYSPAEYAAAFGQTLIAKFFGPFSYFFGLW